MSRFEQKESVLYSLKGKDVLAVLATEFGKSLIHVYKTFVLAKEINERSVVCQL